MYIYIYTCIYIHIYIYICIYVYMYMCICIYAYTYMHIQYTMIYVNIVYRMTCCDIAQCHMRLHAIHVFHVYICCIYIYMYI